MATTNKQLETQVNTLSERVNRLQTSNSELRDELVVIKNNYTTLVSEMSQRLEAIHNTFQAKK
jgi:predicted  nucleic acid-binding Zn-ribbon protein